MDAYHSIQIVERESNCELKKETLICDCNDSSQEYNPEIVDHQSDNTGDSLNLVGDIISESDVSKHENVNTTEEQAKPKSEVTVENKETFEPSSDDCKTTGNCDNSPSDNKGDTVNVTHEVIGEDGENSDAVVKENEQDSPKHEGTESNVPSYDPKNVHYEGELAIYEDPTSGYQYEWNKDREEWLPRNNVICGFEDDTHTYTDASGAKFFWDKDKSAWFPKINDDFMAQYQMNYGFIDNTSTVIVKEQPPKPVEKEKGVKRKPSEPTWFELDEQENTKVYVSNLPTNTKEEEFADLMQKCGLIMRDPTTQKLKIKFYTEPGTNILKGDALCTYIRIESVDLALKLLDGTLFKDKKIKVERAKFEMKGNYDPNLKPKSKKRKEKQKLKKIQEKLFDWRPEKMIGERSKHEKVVIVKNVFDPKVFDEDVKLILEYQQDLREECSKCGDVRKVIIYDRHPEGVAQVNMKEPEEADACVVLLNNRWFGKRQLSAEIWDGKTKYKIAETDSEISQRINEWDKFLEGEGSSNNIKVPQSS